MKATICSGIILSSFTLADLSYANLTFCNSRTDAVWVAVEMQVYQTGYCETYEHPYLVSWYYAPPNGGCVTIINGNLTNHNGAAGPNFEWYAEGANGEYWAGSNAQYCPMSSENAYIPGQTQPICTAQYVNFRYLNTGGYSNYTMNLN